MVCAALTGCGVALSARLPHLGFGLVCAAPLLAVLLGVDPVAYWSVTVFATFAVTVRGLPVLLTGPLACLSSLTAEALSTGTLDVHANPAASIAGFCAAMSALAASAVRSQEQYWTAVRRRTQDAIAAREADVRRSVAEERVRIARDLHDSVGHHVAVLSMHLGAAEVSLPAGSDAAQRHLASARQNVQGVLGEMQDILAVLRLEGGADALGPTPDFSTVPELVSRFREAGLVVEDQLDGCDRDLPHDVSAAAYRITQEALTNAQKHGAGAVRLRVHVDTRRVDIEVANSLRDRRQRDPGAGGRGLVGLAERAETVGGRVRTHRDGGEFHLSAHLPVRGGAA